MSATSPSNTTPAAASPSPAGGSVPAPAAPAMSAGALGTTASFCMAADPPALRTQVMPPADGPRDSTGTQQLAEAGEQLADMESVFCRLLLDVETFSAPREYRLLRRLGSGSQGVVMEATHTGYLSCLTRHALKIFEPKVFPERREYEQELVRIARQVSILQQSYHPNLVQCEDFIHHHGVGILVMEFVDGIDLRSMLDAERHAELRARIPATDWDHFNDVIFAPAPAPHAIQPGVAFYLLRKILRGLEVLHRLGYVHCDIKPSNIMIDRFGTVKIIDYGRAVLIRSPLELTCGSPLYMSPEAHRREPLDTTCDLYSAGLVCLELLHGKPFTNPKQDERALLHFKTTLPARVPEYLPPHVRENQTLVRILRRLLAINPADRFATAGEAEDGTPDAEGARVVHRQLAFMNLDADYSRELARYVCARIPTAAAQRHAGGRR